MCCAVFFPLLYYMECATCTSPVCGSTYILYTLHYFSSPTTNQLYLCPAELTGRLLVLTTHH